MINYKSEESTQRWVMIRCEQTECTVCTVQNVWWKKSESGVKRAKWQAVCTEYVQSKHVCTECEDGWMSSGWHAKYGVDQTIKTCMYRVWGWMNELRVACEVWSTEVCEVSLTKNLRGKPAKRRLGKSRKILRKILRGYLCSRGMSVFMALEHR